MIRTASLASLALIGLTLTGSAAHAELIIGNLNGNDLNNSANLNTTRNKGMGFMMPLGPDYSLSSITLRLNLVGLNVTPIVQLWSNSGLNQPDTVLTTLVNPTFSTTGIANHDFTPSSAFSLESGTTYWLVVSGSGGDQFHWTGNSPAITPTGIASHFGSRFDTNSVPPPEPRAP